MIGEAKQKAAGGRTEGRDTKSTILVVDDEPQFLVLITRMLEARGYDTITSANGRLAMDAVVAGGIDLILTDLQMPGGTGFSLLEELQKDERLGRIPVIVISGYTDQAAVTRTLALGAAAHLPKPLDLTRLDHQIRVCLVSKASADALILELERSRIDARRARRIAQSVVPREAARMLENGVQPPTNIRPDCAVMACVIRGLVEADATPKQLEGATARLLDLDIIMEQAVSRRGLVLVRQGAHRFLVLSDGATTTEALIQCAEELLHYVRHNQIDATLSAGIDVGLVATGLVGETWRTWGAWGPAVDAAEALAARGENAPI
ncbi:MAG: CheY-like chemotaxis protein, partial [Myxococcota bacterium]